MAFIIPAQWSSTVTYTTGQQVLLNGVLYEATMNISAGVNPTVDNAWEVIAVHSIQDYSSLIEAARLNLNVDDDEINRSVPLFIQLAEESFKTRIRAPQQRKRVILTVDSQGRVEVPGDLLEVLNMRENSTGASGGFRDVRSRGVIEILNGNYEEYQRLLRFDQSDNFVGVQDYNAFDAPTFWFDSRYFWIAPIYDAGTEIELVYIATIPQLGTIVSLTDESNNAINSAGMTSAQWVAAGNTAETFVQATQTVTQNWFTAAAPQMLLYGALCKAEGYLKDPERIAQWKALFEAAQTETQDMVNRFEESQPHQIYLENTYSSRI